MKKIIIALLVLMPLSLTAQWEILNEGYKGGINTIDFVNDNIGWLAGSNGTLLKTTDGGENWINIPINETWNISQIDFINESIGWAVGDAIWKSSNGGDTWVQQFSSTVFSFNALYVIDATNVFAVGSNKIYKTSNGGTNWINVSPNLPDRNYNSIWFQDSQTGVVVGRYNDGMWGKGLILRTTNGGETWEQTIVNEFNSIYDLQFLDDTNGYFRAHLDTTNFLCKTEDMCQSWTIITQSPYEISSYQFLDSITVYAIMEDSISTNNVMRSIDGGINWQIVQSSNISKSLYRIFFCKQGTGFILSNLFASTSRSRCWSGSAIYKSIDGDNWSISKFSFPLIDAYFMNKDKGVVMGGFRFGHAALGCIFLTNDGGKSWSIKDYIQQEEFNSCVFVNDYMGFASTYASTGVSIYKTTDGGNNWVKVYDNNYDSTGFSFWGNDICFKDENTGWAVGKCYYGAGIMYTADGGESWNLEWQFTGSANYEYNLQSIYFNNSIDWSVGDGGMIVKYTPQTGWVKQTSVTDLPLNKVFFTDDNHGWIAGGYQNDNGFQKILLKTINGGTNWSTVTNVPYIFKDIAFIDKDLGWAIGYTVTGEGGILETIDGGITWNIDTGNLSSKLNSLFIKDNYGWAVGENGLILRTTDAGAVWVEDEGGNIYPTEFTLEQNYPNPFNPSTSIQYAISSKQLVTLKVYDVLGRELTTLVNEEQPQGTYEIEFDSKALSSGIYFYELRAGSYYATKKMLLLK